MPAAPPGAIPSRAGFTLLELLVVIGLVGALAALFLGAGTRAVESGRRARARAELAALAAALESYRREHGDYPRTERTAVLTAALVGRRGPTGEAAGGRCLLELARLRFAEDRDPLTDTSAQLADPWGRPYRYAYRSQSPWANPRFVLFSAGPDGEAAPLGAGGFHDGAEAANRDNLTAEDTGR